MNPKTIRQGLIVSLAVLSFAARAAVYTWEGDSDTLWANGNNWDQAAVPGAADDILFSNAGPANEPTVATGMTNRNLTVNVAPTITVNALMQFSGAIAGDAGFILAGNNIMRWTGTGAANTIGGTIRLDSGELDLVNTTLSGNALGTATIQLNGGKFHLRTNAGDVTFGNDFLVTANSTIEYDSSGSGNTNPRRFVFGGLTVDGAHTLLFDNNNAGWLHFDGPVVLNGQATFNSFAAEGGARPIFTGAVDDNGFGFIKTGNGVLELANAANDISGAIVVAQGTLMLRDPSALGTPASVTLGAGSTTGVIGFAQADQTFAQTVALGTNYSGFSTPQPSSGSNFQTPTSVVATLTGTISQNGYVLGLGGGLLGGALLLNNGDRSAEVGGTRIAGAVSLTAMDNLSDGNLDINTSGALVFDALSGPDWSDFVAARSAWGTGDSQVQIAGGTFAARNGTVEITLGDIAGAPSGYWNANLNLGTGARRTDGSLYADGTLRIMDDIALTGTKTYTLAGGVTKSTVNYTVEGGVQELAGVLSGDNVVLVLRSATRNNEGGTGILRLSNPNNSLTGASVIALGSSRNAWSTPGGVAMPTGNANDFGGALLLVTSDAAFGGVAEVIVTGLNSDTGVTGGLLLFEDATGAGADFTRGFYVSQNGINTRTGFGAYAGQVGYSGVATLIGNPGSAVSVPLLLHVQSGATLAFDTGATIQNDRGANVTNTFMTKGGAGTLILNDLAYSGSNGGLTAWRLYEGAVREMGTGTENSMASLRVQTFGGVVELGAGDFTRGLGSAAGQINLSGTGGGGFAAHGATRTVNLGGASSAVEWGAGSFVATGAPLIFGSETANARLVFENTIGLANNNNQTVVRTIRVDDNSASVNDVAEITGNLRNRGAGGTGGTGTRGLTKTGAGTLILSGANNDYNGLTTVAAGMLVVNGAITGLGGLTVSADATLGGGGSIAGAVTMAENSRLAPGTSPGTLTVASMTLDTMTYLWELGGSAYDSVTVNGALTFNGAPQITFALRNLDAVDPTGQIYTLFTSTGISGGYTYAFDAESANHFNTAGATVTDDGSNVYLSGLTPVPEPATLALLGLGGALAAWRRRKQA